MSEKTGNLDRYLREFHIISKSDSIDDDHLVWIENCKLWVDYKGKIWIQVFSTFVVTLGIWFQLISYKARTLDALKFTFFFLCKYCWHPQSWLSIN